MSYPGFLKVQINMIKEWGQAIKAVFLACHTRIGRPCLNCIHRSRIYDGRSQGQKVFLNPIVLFLKSGMDQKFHPTFTIRLRLKTLLRAVNKYLQ